MPVLLQLRNTKIPIDSFNNSVKEEYSTFFAHYLDQYLFENMILACKFTSHGIEQLKADIDGFANVMRLPSTSFGLCSDSIRVLSLPVESESEISITRLKTHNLDLLLKELGLDLTPQQAKKLFTRLYY